MAQLEAALLKDGPLSPEPTISELKDKLKDAKEVIKGLYQQLHDKDATIEELRARLKAVIGDYDDYDSEKRLQAMTLYVQSTPGLF